MHACFYVFNYVRHRPLDVLRVQRRCLTLGASELDKIGFVFFVFRICFQLLPESTSIHTYIRYISIYLCGIYYIYIIIIAYVYHSLITII